LVIMVIFLFLRNLSATLIPSMALPMSIVGTFAIMYLLGYNLDNLSLMALTLSVGFVVDDAIVMLENIVRHMELGESAMQASLRGSREIGFTIVSMTISLAAVFLPVLFMSGILGRLLHEFAVTIGAAILVSGLVSLTLTPMLCSRFLRAPHAQRHGKIYNLIERGFDAMLHGYDRTLKAALRFRFAVMAISFVLIGLTVYLFRVMPTGFLPSEDTDQFQVSVEAVQGISFDEMIRHQKQVVDVVNTIPWLSGYFSTVPRGSLNQGMVFVRLIPRFDCPHKPILGACRPHVEQIMQSIRPKLLQLPGVKTYLVNPPPIRIGGYSTGGQYQLTMQSPDLEELYRYSPILEQKFRAVPGLIDVNTDLQIKNPQITVTVDRDKASSLGLSAQQVESALFGAYGSQQVSTIYTSTNTYQVIMELLPQFQNDPSALSMLYIRSPKTSALVPLSTVATITPTVGPLTVNHLGQLPSVTLSFNL